MSADREQLQKTLDYYEAEVEGTPRSLLDEVNIAAAGGFLAGGGMVAEIFSSLYMRDLTPKVLGAVAIAGGVSMIASARMDIVKEVKWRLRSQARVTEVEQQLSQLPEE
jgi:hypothetical protein